MSFTPSHVNMLVCLCVFGCVRPLLRAFCIRDIQFSLAIQRNLVVCVFVCLECQSLLLCKVFLRALPSKFVRVYCVLCRAHPDEHENID